MTQSKFTEDDWDFLQGESLRYVMKGKSDVFGRYLVALSPQSGFEEMTYLGMRFRKKVTVMNIPRSRLEFFALRLPLAYVCYRPVLRGDEVGMDGRLLQVQDDWKADPPRIALAPSDGQSLADLICIIPEAWGRKALRPLSETGLYLPRTSPRAKGRPFLKFLDMKKALAGCSHGGLKSLEQAYRRGYVHAASTAAQYVAWIEADELDDSRRQLDKWVDICQSWRYEDHKGEMKIPPLVPTPEDDEDEDAWGDTFDAATEKRVD